MGVADPDNKRRRTKLDPPHPVDRHVGARVRLRRELLALTRRRLAAAIGTTAAKLSRFESGIERLDARTLYELSSALDVPVTFFFEEDAADTDDGGSLSQALRGLLAVVDLADRPRGIEDSIHQAAKAAAHAALEIHSRRRTRSPRGADSPIPGDPQRRGSR